MRSSDGAGAGRCFHLWNLIHHECRAPFAYGWSAFQRSFLQPSHLSEKGGAGLTFTEYDDTPAHRWIECCFTGFLCGTFTQRDAVTAPCVGFNTYKISCPYLWFVGDYIAYKLCDNCGDSLFCYLLETHVIRLNEFTRVNHYSISLTCWYTIQMIRH